eukprot:2255439-Lingulodinium_polyedra.AAC.1
MPIRSEPGARRGALSGRLERFLLSTLQQRTTQRYGAALSVFRTELAERGVERGQLTEEERGVGLA